MSKVLIEWVLVVHANPISFHGHPAAVHKKVALFHGNSALLHGNNECYSVLSAVVVGEVKTTGGAPAFVCPPSY